MMNCFRSLIGDQIQYNSEKFYQQWNDLKWGDVFKIVLDQLILTTQYGTLPAMICTFNETLGYNNLVLLWLMSILTAYAIHKKRLEEETSLGLFSPTAIVRYTTLLVLMLKCCWLSSVVKFPNKFQNADEIPFRFVRCHSTVIANVALYRLYFTVFGVLNCAVKKFQLKKNITSTPTDGQDVLDKMSQ